MGSHARLGASSSSIWLNCTKAGELFGTEADTPRKDTVYTLEGTCAHEVAEKALTEHKPASAYVGQKFDGWLVDEDMADHVQTYVDHCLSLTTGKQYSVELQVTLNSLWPEGKAPEDLFGTCDFTALVEDTLFVRDLKYGAGVLVEVFQNSQLMYYGLGAYLAAREILSKAELRKIRYVNMGIVQPRAVHPDGPVRSYVIPVVDLLVFATNKIKQTVEDIHAGRTSYKTGDHCRWCPIAGRCPALRERAMAVARTSFDAVGNIKTPPDVKTLSNDELGAILDSYEVLTGWLQAVRSAATHSALQGRAVPGHKIVEKRGNRSWSSEEQVMDALLDAGWDDKDFVKIKETIITPAQIETKKKFRSDTALMERLGGLVERKVTGKSLVPDTSQRQAVPAGPREAFSKVEDL
jgi:hypothetical protein